MKRPLWELKGRSHPAEEEMHDAPGKNKPIRPFAEALTGPYSRAGNICPRGSRDIFYIN
jgi:hypothetical protein